MDIAIPYVRIKQKYQVTIPASIRKNLKLHEGDTLEVKEEGGNLILTPQTVIRRATEYTPNEKTAKILLANDDKKNYQKFNKLDDLFHDLEN